MKVSKETRQFARELLQASFRNGRLDKERIASLVESIVTKKPRNYIRLLQTYKRLLRLEVEKRHARIESASELSDETNEEITANLKKKYGPDLTTEFVRTPGLLGGMRIRVGSDVWDSSVRNRLERLQQQL